MLCSLLRGDGEGREEEEDTEGELGGGRPLPLE